MSFGRKFLKTQNERLEELKTVYRRKAETFVKAFKNNRPEEEQIKFLYELHQAGNKYFAEAEMLVTDSGGLKGQEFEAWRRDWIVTATKNLHELPRYFKTLRANRKRLNLSPATFEPPIGSFLNLQAFFAANCPKDVSSLKALLEEAGIPANGLDTPHMPKPTRDWTWMRPFIWVAVLVILLAAFAIASRYVNIWVLPAVFSVVVVVLVLISAIDLVKDGSLKEKSYVEIVKLALAKCFHIRIGRNKREDDSPVEE